MQEELDTFALHVASSVKVNGHNGTEVSNDSFPRDLFSDLSQLLAVAAFGTVTCDVACAQETNAIAMAIDGVCNKLMTGRLQHEPLFDVELQHRKAAVSGLRDAIAVLKTELTQAVA